jgi:hypothetical protein
MASGIVVVHVFQGDTSDTLAENVNACEITLEIGVHYIYSSFPRIIFPPNGKDNFSRLSLPPIPLVRSSQCKFLFRIFF